MMFCLLMLCCCVRVVWCCCCELNGYVNGASDFRCGLSLFYMCTFQMNPMCVMCVDTSE